MLNTVESCHLLCGSRLYHLYKPGGLVSVRVIVNAGSLNERDPKQYGAAHFLEHMFFKGSEIKDARQISMELSRLGNFNAYTDYDKTVYFVNCLSEDWATALTLLNDMLLGATLPDVEFEKERKVILEEIQTGLDDPSGYFWDEAGYHLWRSAHWIAGTRESVSAMTRDDVLAFKSDAYSPSNIAFVVVGDTGDMDFETLTHLCNAILGPRREDTHFRRVHLQQGFNQLPGTFKHAAQQAFVAMCLPALPVGERDQKKRINLLFLSCLGGGMHSLLFQRLREEAALCYAVGAFEAGFGVSHATTLFAMLSPENVEIAIEKMRGALAEVKANGFSDELIEVARKNQLYGVRCAKESTNALAAIYFDNCFVENPDIEAKERGLLSATKDDLREYAEFVDSREPTIITMNAAEK